MTTAEKILSLIQERGIEQQKLAAHLGINKQTISDWKSGKTKSYTKYIDKIAEFFNVSTDYLLSNEAPQEPSDKTEREVKLIARKTKDLPEEDREALLELLNSTVDTFLKAKGIKND